VVLKLDETHQLLIYAYNVNVLEGNMDTNQMLIYANNVNVLGGNMDTKRRNAGFN
jgi:hypothetical protein